MSIPTPISSEISMEYIPIFFIFAANVNIYVECPPIRNPNFEEEHFQSLLYPKKENIFRHWKFLTDQVIQSQFIQLILSYMVPTIYLQQHWRIDDK